MERYSVLELCAGGGGQAIGLESAGFDHAAAVDIDPTACATLRLNRPHWTVIQDDIARIDFSPFRGVDLIAAGVPCPPFSIAGKQLGSSDERDLFPPTLRIVDELRPAAVLIENVPGFASARFTDYRRSLMTQLQSFGYDVQWRILNAHEFGVPQLRPRFVLIALRETLMAPFEWPLMSQETVTVSQSIGDLMAARGWVGIQGWLKKADRIAPTLVGGSKKHGGPDLGPTRAKRQWADLGVDAHGLAAFAPDDTFPLDHKPRLTTAMTARLQAFPDEWIFAGKKTTVYRQIGNAFPSPVARAIGEAIRNVLDGTRKRSSYVEGAYSPKNEINEYDQYTKNPRFQSQNPRVSLK